MSTQSNESAAGTGSDDGIFQSDIIDLSDLDMATVRKLPNPVLRAAIERVCAELSSDAETISFFQNVTPPPPPPPPSARQTHRFAERN